MAIQGDLFLLEKYIFFVSKTPTLIELSDIHQVVFSRLGAGLGATAARTFDLKIVTKSGPEYTFTSINKEEHEGTEAYLKEKKVKGPGLFTAPPFDPSVLRPRAQVSAPTRSTAADDDGTGKIRFSKEKQVQREREREKDAREKEYMSRQHPTDVDGKWHCSNCGRPEDLAGGKRKGPMGDKSQCAVCGKTMVIRGVQRRSDCYPQASSGIASVVRGRSHGLRTSLSIRALWLRRRRRRRR